MTVPVGHGLPRDEVRLGPYLGVVQSALDALAAQRVVPRIWGRDYTVWKPDPRDIANRLGWLDVPRRMRERVPELQAFAEAALA